MCKTDERDMQKYQDEHDTYKSTGPENLSARPDYRPSGLEASERVKLIFEKRDKSIDSNYSRSISVTSVTGKILEKIIRDKLAKFLLSRILSGISVYCFLPRVYENCHNHISSDVIYLNFQKDFEKAPHEPYAQATQASLPQQRWLRRTGAKTSTSSVVWVTQGFFI